MGGRLRPRRAVPPRLGGVCVPHPRRQRRSRRGGELYLLLELPWERSSCGGPRERRHRGGYSRARGGCSAPWRRSRGRVSRSRGAWRRRRGRRRRRRRRARPREVGWSVRGKPRGLSWETTTRRTPSSRDTDERRDEGRDARRDRGRGAQLPGFFPNCSFPTSRATRAFPTPPRPPHPPRPPPRPPLSRPVPATRPRLSSPPAPGTFDAGARPPAPAPVPRRRRLGFSYLRARRANEASHPRRRSRPRVSGRCRRATPCRSEPRP